MWQILRNMGFRYVWFRLWYEFRRRTGLLKAKFPTNVPMREYVSMATWKQLPHRFFFDSKEELVGRLSAAPLVFPTDSLIEQVEAYKEQKILFFSSTYYTVTDWLTNPSNNFRYDSNKHWTEIADLSSTAGDIKYVWEKSRFSFAYMLIRHDLWHKQDMAETIFTEIESWITANPINQGPNWRCSQELGLRVLNWTFILFYYKNSPALTEARFQKIIHQIYWHLHHIEANISFSRIAVRNNHAITETLSLYIGGLFYPFLKESAQWKAQGKKWFEEEIAYQIDEAGTFLQHSMNYHRVVVQLLTWGIQLAHLNGERFDNAVYGRAQKSVRFLRALQNPHNGYLPNYGNNDGALFFPLSDAHFRDYRPQLAALEQVLGIENQDFYEDSFWLAVERQTSNVKNQSPTANSQQPTANNFNGYHILQDTDTLTFIRCDGYKDRPFQADNLHIDLWVGAENIMRDAGSYLYNTDEKWLNYFAGTASHNTVMLDSFDQMRKGPRFIWYDWVREAKGAFKTSAGGNQPSAIDKSQTTNYDLPSNTTSDSYIFDLTPTLSNWRGEDSDSILNTTNSTFEGYIKAFGHVGKDIIHRRRVTKINGQLHWTIEDWIENAPTDLPMHQIWHPSAYFLHNFSIKAFDANDIEINVTVTEGWYSSLYGQKESSQRLVFSTPQRYIKTVVKGI